MSQHDHEPDHDHPVSDPHPDEPAPLYTPRLRPDAPLSPYILGGTINLLVGSHLSGKSTFLAYLLKAWAEGSVLGIDSTRPPDQVPQRHAFLSTARSWQQLLTTSAAFQALPPTVSVYCLADDATFDLGKFDKHRGRVEAFEHCLDHMGLARGTVVWVDPFMLFLGGNLLDFDACAVACMKIRKVLAARGLTLIGTGMTAKPKSTEHEVYPRLLDRIVGTVSQLAYTDTCFYLATPDELNRAGVTTLQVYSPYAPYLQFDYARTADGQFTPAAPNSEFQPLLTAFPAEGDVSVAELKRALVATGQLSRATLYRLLKECVDLGLLNKVRHGYYSKVASVETGRLISSPRFKQST